MTQVRLLLAIGAEGGSIAIYGDMNDPARPQYKIVLADQTPSFLSDDDGGVTIHKDSGWLPTWAEAMNSLGRYPWPHLAAQYVDPAVANDVWSALQDYVGRSGHPVRENSIQRWRELCKI